MHLMHEEIRKIWVIDNKIFQKYKTAKYKSNIQLNDSFSAIKNILNPIKLRF